MWKNVDFCGLMWKLKNGLILLINSNVDYVDNVDCILYAFLSAEREKIRGYSLPGELLLFNRNGLAKRTHYS